MISQGQDETIEMFAIRTFNAIIKSNVQQFSTKWCEIWPLLRENSDCSKLVEVIGIERAHKMFCKCLEDVKADEVREPHPHHETRKLDQQQMRNLDKGSYGHPSDSG